MAGVTATAVGIAMYVLYTIHLAENRERLVATAQSQARLIEAIARFDSNYSNDYPGSSRTAILSQILDAHADYAGFGETGELSLAAREGTNILFQLPHRHDHVEVPAPIPFDSNFAEPMRRALSGKSGTLIAVDYRGEVVMAAHEPVQVLNMGIVAKIDLAEVREPFIKASILTALVAMFLIGIGVWLFLHINSPLLRRLEQEIEVRRQSEEALALSERKYRSLFETNHEGIVFADLDGSIEMINEAFTQMIGYSLAELGELPPMHFIPEKWHETELAVLASVVGGQGSFGEYEIEYIRRDGTVFPVLIRIWLVRNEHGHAQRMMKLVANITDRRALHEERSQAHRLQSIGQLAAGIAHEINTPAQYISDNTNFLRDSFGDLLGLLEKCEKLGEDLANEAVDPSAVADLAAAIQEADIKFLKEEIPQAIEQSLEGLECVAKIVSSMKVFAHPAGEEKSAVDINAGIERAIIISRNEWKYIAEVDVQLDPDLPQVECFADQINQVILNLIVNAAHAIADVVGDDEKGKLTISTRRDGEWIEIWVADTGAGIPESVRDRIFDPFFTTKDIGQGTGQGLAIAQSVVVKKHGGKLEFDTVTGVGTTFVIRLPIRSREHTIAPSHRILEKAVPTSPAAAAHDS